MKRFKFVLMSLALAASMGLSANAATVSLNGSVAVLDGEMTIKGSLGEKGIKSVNLVVMPKTAQTSDLSSALFLKEGKTDADGNFEFKFVFDDGVLEKDCILKVSDGENNIAKCDFTYYPYADIASQIEGASSAAALGTILTTDSNKEVLGFLGIDAELLDETFIDSDAIINTLFEKKQSESLGVDETVELYTKLTALEFINNNKAGWLGKFNPAFEGKKFADLDTAKQNWLSDNIYAGIEYDDIDALESKYEEFSICYNLNNAQASELEAMIEKYKNKLGITSETYYSRYLGFDYSQKSTMLSSLATELEKNGAKRYSEFNNAFKLCVNNVPQGGSASGTLNGSSVKNNSAAVGVTNLTVKEDGASNGSRFLDADEFEWAAPYIEYLTTKNIISGFGDGTFRPNEFVTREQFVKLINSAFTLSAAQNHEIKFSDVAEDDWFYKDVKRAFGSRIINGISEDLFGVGSFISREDAATILHRVAKNVIGGELPVKSAYKFLDDDIISGYARDSVYAMYHSGVINGVGNDMFAPTENLTRAQAAKMIYCLLTKGE